MTAGWRFSALPGIRSIPVIFKSLPGILFSLALFSHHDAEQQPPVSPDAHQGGRRPLGEARQAEAGDEEHRDEAGLEQLALPP